METISEPFAYHVMATEAVLELSDTRATATVVPQEIICAPCHRQEACPGLCSTMAPLLCHLRPCGPHCCWLHHGHLMPPFHNLGHDPGLLPLHGSSFKFAQVISSVYFVFSHILFK